MDMGYETYQKILQEALEELGVETGITTKTTKDEFHVDCTIETDQPALIPDSYIDITAEKIRIYKQLDSMSSDKELELMKERMEDRFGPAPKEFDNLINVVKIRNMGGKLGFEKIIVKNGMMILFFVGNPMSAYYNSPVFERVLTKVNSNPLSFNLKQNENKLKIVTRGVDTLGKALDVLQKIS